MNQPFTNGQIVKLAQPVDCPICGATLGGGQGGVVLCGCHPGGGQSVACVCRRHVLPTWLLLVDRRLRRVSCLEAFARMVMGGK